MVAPTLPPSSPASSSTLAWWQAWLRLIRVDRPIGTMLVLWPTLWGLWLAAHGEPDPLVFAVFMAGVFLMRSAGCAINDYADRRIDPSVSRTRGRPLATGELTPATALVTALVLTLVAFALVLLMNRLTIALSVVAAFLAASYPFTKRVTHFPQFYLGVAFGWAVPMAFAAQTGAVPPLAWVVFGAVVLWAAAYDTMYAMVDREDDLKIGVKSTAILFGTGDRAAIATLQVLVILVLSMIGDQLQLGQFYFLGVVGASSLFLYQQHLIRFREPQACFTAFLNNNWVGLILFAGIVLDYLRVAHLT